MSSAAPTAGSETAGDGQRPSLSVTEAAIAVGAGVSTIREQTNSGRFPNAQKRHRAWSIPVTDLLAAGYTLKNLGGTPTVTPPPAVAGPSATSDAISAVAAASREQQLRYRAELAEAETRHLKDQLAAVERNANDLRQSLRMLEAGRPVVDGVAAARTPETPEPVPEHQPNVVVGVVKNPKRRRRILWWGR